MQNTIFWIIGAVLVLGGGYYFLAAQSPSESVLKGGTAEDESTMIKDETGDAMKGDPTMQGQQTMERGEGIMGTDGAMAKTGKGSYEMYALEKLARADSGDLVLFFRASWCPTCKALDADIRARLSAIPPTLTILDVDYDNSQVLKQKYGVTYQHTFVQVRSDGSLIKKWSGSPTLAALVAEVQ